MDELEWKDPPSSPRGRSDQWIEVRRQLRRNPGRWALIARDMGTYLVTNINQGRGGWTAGDFQGRSVGKNGLNRADIYARFVGPESSS